MTSLTAQNRVGRESPRLRARPVVVPKSAVPEGAVVAVSC